MTTKSKPVPSTRALSSKLSSSRRFQNNAMYFWIVLGTLVVLLPLFLIFAYLLIQGFSAVIAGFPDFFTQLPKPVGETGGGIAHAIVGSLIMLGIATVLASLIGIGGGIFLAEYAEHRLANLVRVMSDVLTGIPAIVVGLVVYVMLVQSKLTGYSGLAGGIALGLIMIPIVVRATEEVLKLIPTTIREAGLALGLPRWKVILSIVLPSARAGIVTGLTLAVARVSGEAAPLIFTSLGNVFYSNSLVQNPMAALPLQIYEYSKSPYPEEISLAWAGSLVLVFIIFVAGLIARYFTRQRYT